MDCIFCNIVKGVTPSKVIAHNKNAIAFLDVQPISDGHTLVISKEHYRDLSSCPPEVLADVMSLAQEVAKIINESKLRPWGFNFLANEGKIAGQEVMHFHLHVIPKYSKNEGLEIKNGIANKYVGDVTDVYTIIMKSKDNFK